MCTGVRPQTCPKCHKKGPTRKPYTQIQPTIAHCAASLARASETGRAATQCKKPLLTNAFKLLHKDCEECIFLSNKKAESVRMKAQLKKALEESEEATRKEAAREKQEREQKRKDDERDKQLIAGKKADRIKLAKERLKLEKSKWKGTDPAKMSTSFLPSTTPFLPTQEAQDRAKAAAETIPKKTRGAVAKTPKKTKKVTTKADEAMYMSAVNHHQK